MSEVQLSHQGYYLPHHRVIKMSSDTTKLRVIFDGSAVTSTGFSLNDTLHIGPKIQDDLLYILLRFRIHQYVITGDIEKMYRQFLVRPEDRKYQRILWCDTDNCVKTYELNTVTFGLSAAPYLAIKCLQQLAQDEGHRLPSAAKILQQDFYVDDALTGASTIQETLASRNELIELLRLAGLNIRQWASNNQELLSGLSDQNINQKLHLGESSIIKTLGIVWDSVEDSITYTVKPLTHASRVTKRLISSEIVKVHDPLGLLGPVIIVANILLQKIWTLKVDWDESLPMSLHTEWTRYYTQLPLLSNVTFNRKTVITAASTIQLHGFCDASEKAYKACVYLRSTDAESQTQGTTPFSLLGSTLPFGSTGPLVYVWALPPIWAPLPFSFLGSTGTFILFGHYLPFSLMGSTLPIGSTGPVIAWARPYKHPTWLWEVRSPTLKRRHTVRPQSFAVAALVSPEVLIAGTTERSLLASHAPLCLASTY
ncbi:uncharacterized protein LOC143263363 [Megalopta genalis]|uniref:uncharacterized protein LOC143263363 n=1 Tax=Megalopta genalis TaxID=115081 RepID=UPI003FD16144